MLCRFRASPLKYRASDRAGCKLCKYWKINGFRIERKDGEKFSDRRRRKLSEEQACEFRE